MFKPPKGMVALLTTCSCRHKVQFLHRSAYSWCVCFFIVYSQAEVHSTDLDLLTDDGELQLAVCFPLLFPDGIGPFNGCRPDIQVGQICRWATQHASPRFRDNPAFNMFMLSAIHVYEWRESSWSAVWTDGWTQWLWVAQWWMKVVNGLSRTIYLLLLAVPLNSVEVHSWRCHSGIRWEPGAGKLKCRASCLNIGTESGKGDYDGHWNTVMSVVDLCLTGE